MLLRVGELHAFARLAERRARREAEAGGGAQRVGIKAGAGSDVTGMRPPITERQHDRVIRQAGLNMHRPTHGATVQSDFANEGVFFALDEFRFFFARNLQQAAAGNDPELFAQTRTDQNCVVPGNFRHRIRTFLQPTIVGETAVIHLVISRKTHFEIGRRQRRSSGGGGQKNLRTGGVKGDGHHRITRPGEQTIVQEFLESFLAVATRQLTDRGENLGVSIRGCLSRDSRKQLNFGQAVKQRHDHRLNRHNGTIDRPRIAP